MYETLSARDVIETLRLEPHPEGGWYRETVPAAAAPGAPEAATTICYLLDAESSSHWRRVEAAEIWRFCAGAPLSLTVSAGGADAESHLLGPAPPSPRRPEVVVPVGCWRCAATMGAWTLADCTVAPARRGETARPARTERPRSPPIA